MQHRPAQTSQAFSSQVPDPRLPSLKKWRTHRIQTSDECPIHFTCGGYCDCHVETSPGLRVKRRAGGLGARKDLEIRDAEAQDMTAR